MVLKLHAFGVSQPSRSILLLLNEAAVDHEYIPVDILKGESRTEEFLKINPAGMVPVIQDDDFTLTEGGAILTYIARSRSLLTWLPEDPKVEAKINFWMHWNHSGARKSTLEVVRPALGGGKPDFKALKDALDFMDVRLSESGPFLAGTQEPTIADLFILPEIDQLVLFGLFDLAPYANISAWYQALKTALPMSYEANADFVRSLAKPDEKQEVGSAAKPNSARPPSARASCFRAMIAQVVCGKTRLLSA